MPLSVAIHSSEKSHIRSPHNGQGPRVLVRFSFLGVGVGGLDRPLDSHPEAYRKESDMAKASKGEGGKGNAQIATTYGGKEAPIKKMGQEPGTKYGQDPTRRQSGGKK